MAAKKNLKSKKKNSAVSAWLPSRKNILFIAIVALVSGFGTSAVLSSSAAIPLDPAVAARIEVVENAKDQLGHKEYDKQVLKFTDGNEESWCADFVSWIYKKSGKAFVNSSYSGGWRYPVATKGDAPGTHQSLLEYAKRKSAYVKRQDANGNKKPLPGDVIFFGFSHVGIVGSVDDGKVYTIEGNSNDQVERHNYVRSDTDILGYGEFIR